MKCEWKIVAEGDDVKRESGDDCLTLRKDKSCYGCDGFDEKCKAYHAQGELGE